MSLGDRSSCQLDTSKLVELLQQSAVEHLTTFRQLQAQQFGHGRVIATTDYEALYAYKRGEHRRCLQLSQRNVCALADDLESFSSVLAFPEFIQLMDDEIVSLAGLMLLVDPACREHTRHVGISQRSLSLYLMTQCLMKLGLHRSSTLLDVTLNCIEDARRPVLGLITLDQLLLKLTEQKIRSRIVEDADQ